MQRHSYTPQKHRFFNSLVSFVAGITSLGLAIEVQARLPVRAFSSADFLTLVGIPSVAACEFRVFAGPVLDELAANRWPTMVMIDEVPINHAPPHHPLWLTGVQGVLGSMISNAFVQYFEENRGAVESKYGGSVQGWPAVWNFGRVVRNALAHKGIINIQNSNASAVAWRTLSYGPAQNGRSLLFQDLTAVEIILLMEDMDALF